MISLDCSISFFARRMVFLEDRRVSFEAAHRSELSPKGRVSVRFDFFIPQRSSLIIRFAGTHIRQLAKKTLLQP